jgi:hypothetical protein
MALEDAAEGLGNLPCVSARATVVSNAERTFPVGGDTTRLMGGIALEAGLANVSLQSLPANGGGVFYDIQASDGARDPRKPECVSWNTLLGRWTSEGCSVVEVNGRTVRCECSHFTLFAVRESLIDLLPSHLVGSLVILFVACSVLLYVMVDAGPLLQDYGIRVHLLVSILLLILALVVNMAVIRADGNRTALFATGLILHYCLLVIMGTLTMSVVRYYQLAHLKISLDEDASYLRFGIALLWVVPAFVVGLYVAVGYDAGGLSTEKIYGDVFGNKRIAFAVSNGMIVGGFVVELAVLLAASLVLLILRLRQWASSTDRQFTVDESDLLLTLEARRVHIFSGGVWATLVFGTLAVYLSSEGLEIWFSTLAIILAAGAVLYAFRLRRQTQQIAAGTWDPWAGAHNGERPVKPPQSSVSGSQMELRTLGLGLGDRSTHLPMQPSADLRMPNRAYDLPLNERMAPSARSRPQRSYGDANVYSAAGDGGYMQVSADLSLDSQMARAASTTPQQFPVSSPRFNTFGTMTLPPGDAQEEVEFDDLLYALQAGGVAADTAMLEADIMHEGSSLTGTPGNESPSFDMRRVTIADTHL